jgi:[ribosomal protein S18]-alanine N-acetyltransferase
MKSQTRLAVRPFAPADIRSCNAIVKQSEPWKTLGERLDFKALQKSRGNRVAAYVCAAGGGIAGFIVFTPYPVFGRGGYLRALAVAPAMRKQGVGRQLLHSAEKETSRHCGNFYLCVSSFNREAQSFYRRNGYRRVGSIPGLILPQACEYIFWKPLSRGPALKKKPLG